MNEAIQAYLDWKQLQRSCSAHTLKATTYDLEKLSIFLTHHQLAHTQLELQQAKAFAGWLRKSGLQGRSIARCLSTCRNWYHYLLSRKQVSDNPFVGIRAPNPPKRLPEVLSVDQVLALIHQAPKEKPMQLRDACMLECLYACAIRVSELVSIDTTDLDLNAGLVRVTGKGARTRLLPIATTAVKTLRAWLHARTDFVDAHEPALFINRKGGRLSSRYVQMQLQKMGVNAGLLGPVYPHLLRHSCATHLLESSNNLRMVQEFLGHSRLDTTQIYTQVNFQHLSKQYDQHHPRAHEAKLSKAP